MMGWQDPPKYGFDFEIRLNAPDNNVLGKGSLMPPGKQQFAMVNVKLKPVTDGQYHTIYVVSKARNDAENTRAGIGFIQFNP